MEASKQIRAHDVQPSPDGRYPCAYEGCSDEEETPRERISHMFKQHRLETEARLSSIEELLGGAWREKAACRGMDEFVTEPTSRDKANARETGFREPTRGERRAFQVCLTCPVRRSCARASLTPIPASMELPMSTPTLFEPFGIWAGVPADARKQLVKEFGTGAEALEALLRLGEKFAGEYPPNVRRGAHGR